MSETLPILRHKIKGAADLSSVVRTMKAMAAANIGPYEHAVTALADYCRTVELGLVACFRHTPEPRFCPLSVASPKIGAIVFGTDQGMVGQFNERLAELVTKNLPSLGNTRSIWVVGERMQGRMQDAGFDVAALFETPNSVTGVAPLVADLLLAIEEQRERDGLDEVHIFHNQPRRRAMYDPVSKRLLPLDAQWRRGLELIPWPTRALPEIIAGAATALAALTREFLFVSLFRVCAESLAAENARRFAAMRGAEQNINELIGALTFSYNRQRQVAIDEELFDLIVGYEVLGSKIRSVLSNPCTAKTCQST
jgi:F-type H+-transporting ATPase subunit gamma